MNAVITPRPAGILGPGSGRANLGLPDEETYIRSFDPDGNLSSVGCFYIDNITIGMMETRSEISREGYIQFCLNGREGGHAYSI
jgi:hypothetical protein